MQVVDYSFARPDPQAIKSAGYVGVMRYLGYGSKVLTTGERDALQAVGLQIGLVWETSADESSNGYQAGVSDAQQANGQADALGFPAGRPIYYATDGNVYDGTILDYYRGISEVSPRPWGPYGNTALGDACATIGARYFWKVQTWGGPSAAATLEQMPNDAAVIGGTDVNDALANDWGQWDGPAVEEDDMPKGFFAKKASDYKVYFVLGNTKSWVKTPEVLNALAFTGQSVSAAVNVLSDTFIDDLPDISDGSGSVNVGTVTVDPTAIAAAVEATITRRLQAAAAA